MTSTRRTDHDRVRQQADDLDPRWPLRGDLAYDTATSRTGVVIDVPADTATTFYRLTPEGGGEEGWNASLDTLMPAEDAPRPLPCRTPGGAAQDEPEFAPWDDAFGSPDPSPSLQARAECGMQRFLKSAGEGAGEDDAT
ncbi:hypothetical protein [Streptomyces xanthophaeus]|uniref:Uncharacterized protein n=1 Tax=Streptomyces xanthophaeus TaxID=67385 RepID=A0A919GTX4_9ACTN|nr:hypothetical protein [Streptomyces xanthophaeus]GHI84120.1 hypothetical protein Sxan_14840 [Streptomyces xanthophaeus]